MQTTIYIRKENEGHWKSIEDKSQWVNERLGKTAPAGAVGEVSGIEVDKIKLVETSASIDVPRAVGEALDKHRNPTSYPLAPHVKLCKIHETPLDARGRCLQKGCKYA